jgi:hypothetical protein
MAPTDGSSYRKGVDRAGCTPPDPKHPVLPRHPMQFSIDPCLELNHAEMAECLRRGGQSNDPDWDPEQPEFLLRVAAEFPLSPDQLAALAAARTAYNNFADALRTLDAALIVLADAMERGQG